MTVSIFGMGLMGQPMAIKLCQANIPVMVYNRTLEKLTSFKAQNIPITNNAQDAIIFGNCLILMLTDIKAIEAVILDSYADLTDKTIIQMGTISPDESQKLLTQIELRGGEYLEAPVLGSIPEVKNGDLLVMVGATKNQFDRWQDLLKNYSPEPILVGKVGTASALKLALNQMIAGLTSTFALSLRFIQQQGVEVSTFMDILRNSALYAPTFDKKLSRMSDGNYQNPNFPTKHLLKDINLFLTSAAEKGLNTQSLEGIKAIVSQTVNKGYGDSDYSALIESIAQQTKQVDK
ncbi:NAD(P)-dependent oxidoreductase [Geminocystis sp. NIES-3708]|uniref:NAD(P)-dependent oxidoreductase n=1 Tax=Geminocystis sp. NIES-3708 TaxID=1615909 RepID=UPI0037BFC621